MIISNYLRGITLIKYNVEETNCYDFKSKCMNTLCNNMYYGCHYPCSLYQIYVSIEYWDQEEIYLPINNKTSEDKSDINWKLYE